MVVHVRRGDGVQWYRSQSYEDDGDEVNLGDGDGPNRVVAAVVVTAL